MEGYLQKYINVVYRWKPRYFILKNGILTYSDQKGDLVKGTIYLKISEIILTPEDPLKIIINSGTKTLHLRANSIGDKIKWINALRLSQEEIIKNQEEEMKNSIHHQQNSKYSIESFNSFTPKANKEKNLLNFSDFINKKIHELSHLQINLNDILKEFEKKIEIDNNLMQFFEKIKFTIDEILVRKKNLVLILLEKNDSNYDNI